MRGRTIRLEPASGRAGKRDIVATAGFATSDVVRVSGDDAPWVAIRIDGANATLNKSERIADGENTQFTLTFRRPIGSAIDVEALRFAAPPPGHRQVP